MKQNLKVYAKLYGVKNYNEKIQEVTDLFKVNHILNRRANKLSSGEHTRMILAKSFLNDPKVIFMDECTVGLDPDVAEHTRQIILDYNRDRGCSILFTSHYMYEVEELCNKVVFMENGKIVKIGTPKDIKKTMTNQTIELDVVRNRPKLMSLLKNKGINFMCLDKNLISFQIDSKEHNLQNILNVITNNKISFKDIHIKKPTLDDFFIKLARKKRTKRK